MPKSIEINIQFDPKPFDDFAKAVNELGISLTSISCTKFFGMIDVDKKDDLIDLVESFNNSFVSLDLKWQEPANMPIELRLQYQYQFWMTPMWFIQDKWYEWRNKKIVSYFRNYTKD